MFLFFSLRVEYQGRGGGKEPCFSHIYFSHSLSNNFLSRMHGQYVEITQNSLEERGERLNDLTVMQIQRETSITPEEVTEISIAREESVSLEEVIEMFAARRASITPEEFSEMLERKQSRFYRRRAEQKCDVTEERTAKITEAFNHRTHHEPRLHTSSGLNWRFVPPRVPTLWKLSMVGESKKRSRMLYKLIAAQMKMRIRYLQMTTTFSSTLWPWAKYGLLELVSRRGQGRKMASKSRGRTRTWWQWQWQCHRFERSLMLVVALDIDKH